MKLPPVRTATWLVILPCQQENLLASNLLWRLILGGMEPETGLPLAFGLLGSGKRQGDPKNIHLAPPSALD